MDSILTVRKSIVFRKNSFIDRIQKIREWGSIRAFVFNFVFCQILLFVSKVFLYDRVHCSIEWLGGILLIVMASFCLIEMLCLNFSFKSCFSDSRIQDALVEYSNSNFYFKYDHFRYGWYPHFILCLSLLLNVVGILLISYYDELYYQFSRVLVDYYAQFNLKSVARLLEQIQSRSVVSELLLIAASFIALIVVYGVFRCRRESGKEIFKVTVNESQEEIPNSIRQDGVSIVLKDSSISTLDLRQDVLEFLFGSIIILNKTKKTMKVYLDSELKKIVVVGNKVNKEIVYDQTKEEWEVHSLE